MALSAGTILVEFFAVGEIWNLASESIRSISISALKALISIAVEAVVNLTVFTDLKVSVPPLSSLTGIADPSVLALNSSKVVHSLVH